MHLAQLNIARLAAQKDDPKVADFIDNLDRINGLGKRMPGFVWLLEGGQGPERGATDLIVSEDDPLLMPNLSVWEDVVSLEQFVFGTIHKRFFDRRAEWFEDLQRPYFVMWQIDEGHEPTIKEALERLAHFTEHGASDYAFGWDFAKATLHKVAAE